MTHGERMNKVAVLKAAKTKKDVAKAALKASPQLDKEKAKTSQIVDLLEKLTSVLA